MISTDGFSARTVEKLSSVRWTTLEGSADQGFSSSLGCGGLGLQRMKFTSGIHRHICTKIGIFKCYHEDDEPSLMIKI